MELEITNDTGNFKFRGIRALNNRQIIVVVLATLTGLLHLFYGIFSLSHVGLFNYLFILNFFGNMFFIVVLYSIPALDKYHTQIKWIFVLFTLSSIISYFYVYFPGGLSTLLFPSGVYDKLIEIALIIFLILEDPLEKDTEEDIAPPS